MKFEALTLQPLKIPFKVRFRHHSAERSSTESVLVQAHTGRSVGSGEGCPRSYVTQETVPSCERFFAAHREEWLASVRSLGDLSGWIETHAAEIDAHPAAWCAVELALLDALALEEGRSVEALLGLPEPGGEAVYTAVLGQSEETTFVAQLDRYVALGFQQFKVKIGGDAAADRIRILRIRERVDRPAIRLDGNNLWQHPPECLRYLEQLGVEVDALEEPLRAGDLTGLHTLAAHQSVPLILDESFTRIGQLTAIAASPDHFWINLRVSKLGGLLRSLAVAREAERAGVPTVVGAQVGETSILTRAALPVARACGKSLRAQEGAFGTQLLQHDIVANPLMFGAGGRLAVAALLARGGGFGLRVIRPDRA